jgi:mannose-6-phosphate isomerase-like protein (cupin superfamily)
MERLKKVSLREKFASFNELWQPKTVALVDDFAVKLVKIEGEFVWHRHADADEIFFVIAGGIRMQYRSDGEEYEEAFGPGELLRVPRGVEHLPVALPGTELVLFERADLVNIGDVENERRSAPISAKT